MGNLRACRLVGRRWPMSGGFRAGGLALADLASSRRRCPSDPARCRATGCLPLRGTNGGGAWCRPRASPCRATRRRSAWVGAHPLPSSPAWMCRTGLCSMRRRGRGGAAGAARRGRSRPLARCGRNPQGRARWLLSGETRDRRARRRVANERTRALSGGAAVGLVRQLAATRDPSAVHQLGFMAHAERVARPRSVRRSAS